ncbi:hypothetical protein COTV030 [Cotia virus SPAn232]|uniref:Uncharacterized protein n=2 Tax=Cotia virus TaxID=39444 RepID=A0A097IVN5_9POXV|nr:hypothetical protein COTV030 [Cotia virus SPAn232]AFB76920.1 hypothetical protein COTV030 [Cotia virus SPAn232]AIT70645.1 hypothetical protein [Cotia virus]
MNSLKLIIIFILYVSTIYSFNYNSVNITIEINDVNNSDYNIKNYTNLNIYKIITQDFTIELTKRSKQRFIYTDYNVINNTGIATFYTDIGNRFSYRGSYSIELTCESIFNIYGDYLYYCDNTNTNYTNNKIKNFFTIYGSCVKKAKIKFVYLNTLTKKILLLIIYILETALLFNQKVKKIKYHKFVYKMDADYIF